MGTITQEVQESSVYFDGEPDPGWELLTIWQNRRYNIYYYRDRQGGCHHKAVPRRDRYNPFEVKTEKKDGIEYARVINKKTGQNIL